MADNRYNTFKYGTSHKYGASSLTTDGSLAWGIEVDWNGDGVFDGTNEASYLMKAPTIKRGRRTMLRPAGQGFESIRTGQCTVVLSNHDGRYDAWNTSSPLYPNVESGKDIKIRVLDRDTGIIYARFYGIIQDIVPSGYGADAIVSIQCDDTMRVLRDSEVLAQRPYTDGTFAPASIDSCISKILTTMQWPTRWGTNIESSSYGIRYWYSDSDRSAAVEIEDIALSFFGYFFIDNTGQAKFINNMGNRTSVMSIDESELLKDIGNPQPWTIRRQVVKLRFHVRQRADDAKVWTPLAEDPMISAGNTREYFIGYTYNGYPAYAEDEAQNILFSKNPYVWELVGSGVVTNVTKYGIRAFWSVFNGSVDNIFMFPDDETREPSGTYIQGDITWTERADTISNPRDPSTVVNPRSLVLDSLWYQDRNQAYDFVDEYQAFISALHKTPIIQIENRFAKQFTPDLFDVITVSISTLGISSETFRVGAIEEEAVGETTQAVRTTFYLEPFVEPIANVGIWDASVWDTGKWGW